MSYILRMSWRLSPLVLLKTFSLIFRRRGDLRVLYESSLLAQVQVSGNLNDEAGVIFQNLIIPLCLATSNKKWYQFITW
jgi:hypothetical protein